jgi:Xaa-Pro aminopeptidase
MAMRPSAGNIVQPAGENVGSRESRVLHRVDQTERELWSILAVANAAAGGDFIDYPLLLSGEHIIPWGEDATDRRVAAGEFVAFDVGLSNEWPSIAYDLDWESEGSGGKIEEHMVLAVESMVAPDEGGEGVKLEDMVVVEKGGCRRLSLYPFESALLA